MRDAQFLAVRNPRCGIMAKGPAESWRSWPAS